MLKKFLNKKQKTNTLAIIITFLACILVIALIILIQKQVIPSEQRERDRIAELLDQKIRDPEPISEEEISVLLNSTTTDGSQKASEQEILNLLNQTIK